MLKLMLLVSLLTVGAVAEIKCSYYADKASKEIKGIDISSKDRDINGMLRSCSSFKYWSKFVLLNCTDKDINIKEYGKERDGVIEYCGKVEEIKWGK